MSRIVVMGSGETTPTMVRIHREVFASSPPGPAVMIDTPFAFQMNRDELVARTRLYFSQSVGRELDIVEWPPREEGTAASERPLALLDQATWAFAGPGSPTYALGQWRGTGIPAALTGVVRRGGTVVFGSAAALTLGTHTIPVYEIYKVGAEPEWVDGLDLMGQLCGFPVALIPHYDNREGGTHDTRFCYLGELRLAMLEARLPDEVGILGVDEHTAMLIDLEAGSVTVSGNGVVSVRRRGDTRTFAAGEQIALTDLEAMLRGRNVAPAPAARTPERSDDTGADVPTTEPVATSLREEADRARAAFDTALAARDAQACVSAVLDLEDAIAAWSADTNVSDDTNEARRVLRALVVRLGELAEGGARDPREVVAPYVELLLELRAAARANKDFATSDLVRDRLVAMRVEVHDTPEGSSWELSDV